MMMVRALLLGLLAGVVLGGGVWLLTDGEYWMFVALAALLPPVLTVILVRRTFDAPSPDESDQSETTAPPPSD